MNFVCLDGAMIAADQPLFDAQNRSFRYGDGLFETAKVWKGKLLLEDYHFDRLFFGLKMLQINADGFSKEKIVDNIIELCKKNHCIESARVRLAVYRNDLQTASYLIEAFHLPAEINTLNTQGWKIGLHPYIRKSVDAYSNLKTANYLPYVLADLFAKEKGWDECLVLNTENKICDGSKTNLFLLIKDEILTSALNQGCVNGVKRRFVIEELKKLGVVVHQQEISEDHLLQAEEVFLTNAIQDIRWVQSFRNKSYRNSFITNFYQQAIAPIYSST